ncbi:MAG: hypothetical protein BZY88_03165 [SAR202 cluster bacterium Io17-Chloro-G9]|nr:MAG: hypothetical protein BZY88_03165 [SAR202 cluster bacterium Io17-Chloro-G9]
MAKRRHIPERTCVACGKKMPKPDLVRIVRTPQGELQVDTAGKSPGRGAYLCRDSDCWQKSVRKGGLERSLGATLAPIDHQRLYDSYQELMAGQPSEMR